MIWFTAQAQEWGDPVLLDFNRDTIGINTGAQKWCPFVSADGNYFYFTRERINNDLYVCHRTDSGWSDPLMLPFCQVDLDERNPSVNATNDTLYFISWAPGWDIFWSFRTGPEDTSWSQPERLPEPINSAGIEFAVWATPDNQRLLFASWRISANGEDIYECRRDASSETGWSEPRILQGELNTGRQESYPTMGNDTTEIFFWRSTSRLFRSFFANDQWTNGDELPENINRVIIRDPSETTPCVTADGRRLYFSSRWNGDSVATAGDIWYSERSGENAHIPPRLPTSIHLSVYPNPFNSTLNITLTSPLHQDVTISLYDLLGREVDVLQRGRLSSTTFSYATPATLASGLYFLRAQTQSQSVMQKVILLKPAGREQPMSPCHPEARHPFCHSL